MGPIHVTQEVNKEEQSSALFKKRGPKKGTIRKRDAQSLTDSASSDYSSADEDGQKAKRHRKVGGVIVSSLDYKTKTNNPDLHLPRFDADRTPQINMTNDATKQSNWYDDGKEREQEKMTASLESSESVAQRSTTYTGAANYQTFIQKNSNTPSKLVGPMKAPTNIRTITVTDFSPDVCKDYKQTGFCGFGDNCKYLHQREDYKQGWQLDREWENVTKGKKVTGGQIVSSRTTTSIDGEVEDDLVSENIPFACVICKEPYRNPVVTRCGHYFCEACALKRFRKTSACAACGAGTGGVFNGAKKLEKLRN